MKSILLKIIKILVRIILIIIIGGLMIPQRLVMPVKGGTKADYNIDSFWYYPWGNSITHKGVDIFARGGTRLNSSTMGFVLYCGHNSVGGNIILILGPKWRFHYYAHLQGITTKAMTWVDKNEQIGTVGASGNAIRKAPHLHYSITTAIPYLWRIDFDEQGWMKMFYLNPIDYIED